MKEILTPMEHQHDDKCGCGHDHSHDHKHEEGCGCGHDHSHDHEEEDGDGDHAHHTHAEECGCGHDHEHHVHAAHRHEPEDSSNESNKNIFILENLGCANCAAKMEAKINQLPGVESATITYATKQLRLHAADGAAMLPTLQEICAGIESQVKVVPQIKKVSRKEENRQKVADATNEKAAARRSLAEIIVGASLFVIGLLLEHLGFDTRISMVIDIIAYVILGGRIVLEAAKNLTKGHVFDENFLMSIATLGAFAIQDYPEAVGVMLFFRVGEYFEDRAVARSRSQIMDAVDMRPEVVNLVTNNEVKVIGAEEANVGDILLVRPGDRIPLDGKIIEGESRIDTSPVTGEPVPVKASAGNEVISGCVNISGQLKMRVEKPLSESMVTRILNSVENAAASKPEIEKFITRFARIYTPIVVLLAAATAIIPSLFTGNWDYWIYTALSFLVMSCPCALVLSVPLAFFSGIGAGSKKGILFKGGAAIEALNRVNTVVMDKTGTITEGNFVLQKVVSTGEMSEEDILKICASCEQHSTHPIGSSIVSAALERGISLEEPETLEEVAGHGIHAKLARGMVLCGNKKLMNKYQISLKAYENQSYGSEVLVAADGVLQGYLIISDTVKKDAVTAIAKLKRQNITTAMLTGDAKAGAEAVAKETGIDEVHAKLLPEDKLEELKKIRANRGAVMFVGDGINDAPVLAGADVGAAMGSGADAAIEAADVVFMTSDMEAIPDAIKIAKSSSRISKQNVIFALAIKIIVMILGLAGYASMWMAVFADSGVAMLCVLNSIRILYKKS